MAKLQLYEPLSLLEIMSWDKSGFWEQTIFCMDSINILKIPGFLLFRADKFYAHILESFYRICQLLKILGASEMVVAITFLTKEKFLCSPTNLGGL